MQCPSVILGSKNLQMVNKNLTIKLDQHQISGKLTPCFIVKHKVVAQVNSSNARHEAPYEHEISCPARDSSSTLKKYFKWTKYSYFLQPLVLELDFDKYFPYKQGDSDPIYDENTGETLRDWNIT